MGRGIEKDAGGGGRLLRLLMVPAALALVFGMLDLQSTSEAAWASPLREANPFVREIFLVFGQAAPALVAVLWIALWSSISIILEVATRNVMPRSIMDYIQLVIFYSLAVGHFFAWNVWRGGISIASGQPPLYFFPYILAGAMLAAAHCFVRCFSAKSGK